jgi:hypothetical protein
MLARHTKHGKRNLPAPAIYNFWAPHQFGDIFDWLEIDSAKFPLPMEGEPAAGPNAGKIAIHLIYDAARAIRN